MHPNDRLPKDISDHVARIVVLLAAHPETSTHDVHRLLHGIAQSAYLAGTLSGMKEATGKLQPVIDKLVRA